MEVKPKPSSILLVNVVNLCEKLEQEIRVGKCFTLT